MGQVMLVQGDARQIPLKDQSVHCIITSPPFWGLRDYGVAGQLGLEAIHDCLAWARGNPPCSLCFVCNLRTVFLAAWRVLREDGTLWLNLSDTYARNPQKGDNSGWGKHAEWCKDPLPLHNRPLPSGIRAKNLLGMPWRVALALQQDGWVLRSDIIWHSPNKMPESTKDRPTRAYEHIFLFAKQAQYYFDAQAIAEPMTTGNNGSSFTSAYDTATKRGLGLGPRKSDAVGINGRNAQVVNSEAQRRDEICSFSNNPALRPGGTRNARDVWTFPSAGFAGEHYAAFPPELARRCILAGTSEAGCCSACGKAWVRVVERQRLLDGHIPVTGAFSRPDEPFRPPQNGIGHSRYSTQTTEHGWAPACACNAGEPAPNVVFDPFTGSSTTLLVARALGRHAIGCDLSWTYLHKQSRTRLQLDQLDAWEGRNGQHAPDDYADLPLFATEDVSCVQ